MNIVHDASFMLLLERGTQLAPFRENILAIGNKLLLIPVYKDIDSTQSEAASAAAIPCHGTYSVDRHQ